MPKLQNKVTVTLFYLGVWGVYYNLYFRRRANTFLVNDICYNSETYYINIITLKRALWKENYFSGHNQSVMNLILKALFILIWDMLNEWWRSGHMFMIFWQDVKQSLQIMNHPNLVTFNIILFYTYFLLSHVIWSYRCVRVFLWEGEARGYFSQVK